MRYCCQDFFNFAMVSGFWKKCSTCKKPIPFGATYWLCNVSTCNRKRLGLFFCSVECWDGHLPIVRHREAWSVEKRAPTEAEWKKAQQDESITAPSVSKAKETKPQKGGPMESNEVPKDILVVVSKLKAYVRAKSGMNTSADVMETLSNKLRRLCDDVIVKARQDGRKTVMARDF